MNASAQDLAIADLESLWCGIGAAGPRDLDERSDLNDFSLAYPSESGEGDSAQYARRRTFIALYAYAVPTREALADIARFVGQRKLLEICAGSGLWACLLSALGVDVLATDGAPPRTSSYERIEIADAEDAVLRHLDRRCLMVCWPPYKQDVALRALRRFIGDRLIYIGDPLFTANLEFHVLLREAWNLVETLPLPSWPGLRDAVRLYVKRSREP